MRKRAKSGFLASASPESHFLDASKRFNRARQEPSSRFPALTGTFDTILHDFARFCYTRNCQRVFVLPHFPLAFAHFHMLVHALMHVKMPTRPLFFAHFQSHIVARVVWHTTLTPPRFSTSLHTSAFIMRTSAWLPNYQSAGWRSKFTVAGYSQPTRVFTSDEHALSPLLAGCLGV